MFNSIFMKAFYLLLFCLPTFLFAQHKQHTNGIEPYYTPELQKNYLSQIDKSYHPFMFASPEDMQWWKDAKLGLFIHWAPSVVCENALSWGRKGARPHHPSDGKVTE